MHQAWLELQVRLVRRALRVQREQQVQLVPLVRQALQVQQEQRLQARQE